MTSTDLVLEPADRERLINLCGPQDCNLKQVERHLGVEIRNFGNSFRVTGKAESVAITGQVMRALYRHTRNQILSQEHVHLSIHENSADTTARDGSLARAEPVRTRNAVVRARSLNQHLYLEQLRNNELCFGIGPAGTGKSFLAVAGAVEALEHGRVQRLVLVRPAVEAGERLGFLPGDMAQKVDPYLRPLYDCLEAMLGRAHMEKYVDNGTIEVLPLAFMRGRTLNECFIILDEAQNTTIPQMKMFLTRMGYGSMAVVTGDVTQVDLPDSRHSGLTHAIHLLRHLPGAHFTFFNRDDVVRHPLVAAIIDAYHAECAARAAPPTGDSPAHE